MRQADLVAIIRAVINSSETRRKTAAGAEDDPQTPGFVGVKVQPAEFWRTNSYRGAEGDGAKPPQQKKDLPPKDSSITCEHLKSKSSNRNLLPSSPQTTHAHAHTSSLNSSASKNRFLKMAEPIPNKKVDPLSAP